MRPDGTGQQRLTSATVLNMHDGHPTWAPNGRRIAFSRSEDDGAFGHIFTVRPDGGDGVRQVTSGDVTDIHPDWGPR